MPSAIDNGNLPAERGVTNEMGGELREGGPEAEEGQQRRGALKLAAHQSRNLQRYYHYDNMLITKETLSSLFSIP